MASACPVAPRLATVSVEPPVDSREVDCSGSGEEHLWLFCWNTGSPGPNYPTADEAAQTANYVGQCLWGWLPGLVAPPAACEDIVPCQVLPHQLRWPTTVLPTGGAAPWSPCSFHSTRLTGVPVLRAHPGPCRTLCLCTQ